MITLNIEKKFRSVPEYAFCYILFLFATINICNAQTVSHGDEFVRLAEEYKRNQNPDSAFINYEKATVEFQKTGDSEKLVNSLNQMGIILTRQDQYEKAKVYLDKALLHGQTALDSNNLLIATTYLSLGVVHAAEGNFDQSLICHHKALSMRLLKLGENHADVATSYGNIGNVYLRSKDFDKSIEAHLKAKKIREDLFGKTGAEVTQSYTHLGNAYREKGNYKASLEYFEKALQNKILQQGEGHKDLARFYKNISEVYYLMENKEQGDIFKAKSENL